MGAAPADTLREDPTAGKKKKAPAPSQNAPAPSQGGGGNSTPSAPPPTTPAEEAPTLSAVTPEYVTVGSVTGNQELKLTGTRFAAGAKVDLAGTQYIATVRNPTELTVQVPGDKLGTSGALRLSVVSAQNKESNALSFTVANPSAVTIATLSPQSVVLGQGQAVNLTINGSGFIASSTVKFNGNGIPTRFVSSTQLAATLNAPDNAARFNVTVENGNNVVSLPTSFEVRNPSPTISASTPNALEEGTGTVVVTIDGNNFTRASQVIGAGSPLGTGYVSSTRLQATVPSKLLAKAGTFKLSVQTPTPGGGNSGSVNFTVTAKPVQNACQYPCAQYGYRFDECYDGWYCNYADCLVDVGVCGGAGGAGGAGGGGGAAGGGGANLNCLYECKDYGYNAYDCIDNWYCIPDGAYAGCLEQVDSCF